MAKFANDILMPWAVPLDFSGNNGLGYYTMETVQRYTYGTLGITRRGKVFAYSCSKGTLYAGYGAANTANGSSNTIARLINSITPAAYVAGQKSITVTIAATEAYAGNGVIAADELAGTEIVIGHGAAATTETRTVVGNTVGASGGGIITVELEYPLAVAHAAGVACELPLNPYAYLDKGAYEFNAFMVVPNYPATTGYNFWGQAEGPCFVVPGGGDTTPGDTVNDRTAYFVGDGSVNFGTALTVETGYQKAGYCIDPTVSGTSAMPLVMLQLL